MSDAPTCPYCNNAAELVDSAVVYGRSYGLIWRCAPCDAYVGVHKGTREPLGTLANERLRNLRIRCHDKFDPWWRSGEMSRGEAYLLLQEIMGMTAQEAHIGMFTEKNCSEFLELHPLCATRERCRG